MSEEKKNEETKFTPEDVEESAYEPDPDPEEDEEPAGEVSTIIEKFMEYEIQTKIGIFSTLLVLLGLIFRWYWLNANWWLILIIGGAGVKTLWTQMRDLEEEKPEEAKLAKYSFVTLITLLIIRDLWLTSYFGDLIRYLPGK